MTRLVATLAVRTGIAPQALADCSPEMLMAILNVLQEDAKAHEEAMRGVKSRR